MIPGRGGLLNVGLLLVGAIAVLYRVGPAGPGGVVWAEDGTVFLGGAYVDGVTSAFTPYAGYLLVPDRLVAVAIAFVVPIAAQGVAVNVAASLMQSAVALLAWHVAKMRMALPLTPWLVWLAVILVPTGPETAANLANSQWFLLFGGCIASWWVPTRRPGQVASVAAVVALALNCPFGPIGAVVAACAWLVTRSRFHLALATAGGIASAIQLVTMMRSSGRELFLDVDPVRLVGGYLNRVLADGVWGIAGLAPGPRDTPLWPVVTVCAAIVLLLGAAIAAGRRTVVLHVAVMGLLSFGLFVVPVVLGGGVVNDSYNVGRYFVAPTLFVLFALTLLVDQAIAGVARGRRTEGWLPAILAGATAVAMLSGMVRSYDAPTVFRSIGPPWSDGVRTAQKVCGDEAHVTTGPVQVTPPAPKWVVAVPCDQLR